MSMNVICMSMLIVKEKFKPFIKRNIHIKVYKNIGKLKYINLSTDLNKGK